MVEVIWQGCCREISQDSILSTEKSSRDICQITCVAILYPLSFHNCSNEDCITYVDLENVLEENNNNNNNNDDDIKMLEVCWFTAFKLNVFDLINHL